MPRVKRPRKVVPAVIDKQSLAKAITRFLDDNQMTQTEASYIIRDSPSQLSLIKNGKLAGISAERMIRMLTLFGKDVDVRIRKAKGTSGKVRVSVS